LTGTFFKWWVVGNGKIDLILKYRGKIFALELKSFKDMYTFERGIDQAAEYGQQMSPIILAKIRIAASSGYLLKNAKFYTIIIPTLQELKSRILAT
jgi:hypothetical protein